MPLVASSFLDVLVSSRGAHPGKIVTWAGETLVR